MWDHVGNLFGLLLLLAYDLREYHTRVPTSQSQWDDDILSWIMLCDWLEWGGKRDVECESWEVPDHGTRLKSFHIIHAIKYGILVSV